MTEATIEFLEKLKELGYYDEEKHDYHKVDYVSDYLHVEIICKEFNSTHEIKPLTIYKKGIQFNTNNAVCLSFEDARNYMHLYRLKLGINTVDDWRKLTTSGKYPYHIPKNPSLRYRKEGWVNIRDFLGVRKLVRKGVALTKEELFNEMKKYSKKRNITKQKDWAKLCKSGKLPKHFKLHYRGYPEYFADYWVSWKDFLGVVELTYEESKKLVHELGLKTYSDWKDYTNSDSYNPILEKYPRQIFKDNGWISWGDWLNSDYVSEAERIDNLLSYEEAKKVVHKFGIPDYVTWTRKYHTLDIKERIPLNVHSHYKNKGWVSWGDFLGHNKLATRKRVFLPYHAAKAWVKLFGIKTYIQYKYLVKDGKIPHYIPKCPDNHYQGKGWVDWNEFLNT